MIIDDNIISQAHQFKKEADAAYLFFKKNPSVTAADAWTTATRTYNNFCVKAITKVIEELEGNYNKQEKILSNIESYKTCKQCGAELLYLTEKDHYIASSDFIEDFPGWCYPCLIEYCVTHECEGCTVTSKSSNCPFSEVKKRNMPEA